MKNYIIELESNCWVAKWEGDPGRTIVKKNAEIFNNKLKAEQALKYARMFRPFKFAKIIRVPILV
tara:strand:- start:1030 stop:1224 length:195 start_codon:yes stop_codon:yes gene_type:complete